MAPTNHDAHKYSRSHNYHDAHKHGGCHNYDDAYKHGKPLNHTSGLFRCPPQLCVLMMQGYPEGLLPPVL